MLKVVLYEVTTGSYRVSLWLMTSHQTCRAYLSFTCDQKYQTMLLHVQSTKINYANVRVDGVLSYRWRRWVVCTFWVETLLVILNDFLKHCRLYSSADKPLARPGRKQVNVPVRMAWISFGAFPCKEKKKNLMRASVSNLLKSRASVRWFRACFLPGRGNDLSAPRISPQTDEIFGF